MARGRIAVFCAKVGVREAANIFCQKCQFRICHMMLSGHPVQYFLEIWKMEWGTFFLLSRSQTYVGTRVCLVLYVMCIRRAQEEDLVQS